MATTDVRPEPPLIVIVGPTASGKTSLAIELAEHFNGEIICADSRTVYKDMDIGTAKPTCEEQARVPHWALDLVEPGTRFTAADFKRYADTKIDDIRSRGCIPFLVGGTGLYIDAVIFNYQFGGEIDEQLREYLSRFTIEQLHEYCVKHNIILPENKFNKRYVIRAIEQKGISSKMKGEFLSNTIVVGISTDRQILRTKIRRRVEQMFDDNVVEEATMLGKEYGWSNEAMTGNIYRLIHQYLKNELTYSELVDKSTTNDWRLAKRQMTWLKRNTSIKWLDLVVAHNYLAQILAKTLER